MSLDPLDPDRATAQRWAVEELLRREYRDAQPNVVEQAVLRLLDYLRGLLANTGGVPPRYGLLIGLVVLAALVVVALVIAGPVRRTVRRSRTSSTRGVLADQTRTAAEHRRAAVLAAGGNDHSTAVQERFRAVARSLEERVVLDPRPGRTADEVAVEGGAILRDAARSLNEAARAFDDVTYGERTGTQAMYDRVVLADDEVARARPGREAAELPMATL